MRAETGTGEAGLCAGGAQRKHQSFHPWTLMGLILDDSDLTESPRLLDQPVKQIQVNAEEQGDSLTDRLSIPTEERGSPIRDLFYIHR